MARKTLRALSDAELDARLRAARAPTLPALHRKTLALRREWLRRDHPISDYEKARAAGDQIRAIEDSFERERAQQRHRAQQQAQEGRERGRQARLGRRSWTAELVREAFALAVARRRRPDYLPTWLGVENLLRDASAIGEIKNRLLRRGIFVLKWSQSEDDPDDPGAFLCWTQRKGKAVPQRLSRARAQRIVSEERARLRTPAT